MFSTILTALLGKALPAAADFFMKKEALKQEVQLEILRGKAAYEAAKTQRASESEGRDHEWELESIRNSGKKDEWILFLLSIPLVLVFIPKTAPYVQIGFQILETTPSWYRWMTVMIFCAVYGIRVWRRELK